MHDGECMMDRYVLIGIVCAVIALIIYNVFFYPMGPAGVEKTVVEDIPNIKGFDRYIGFVRASKSYYDSLYHGGVYEYNISFPDGYIVEIWYLYGCGYDLNTTLYYNDTAIAWYREGMIGEYKVLEWREGRVYDQSLFKEFIEKHLKG